MLEYSLKVELDPGQAGLHGEVELTRDRAGKLILYTAGLQSLYLDREEVIPKRDRLEIVLEAGQAVKLNYSADLENSDANFVDPDNLFLTRHWYPQPDSPAIYHLDVGLPPGFIARAEAEQISEYSTENGGQGWRFSFPHPLDQINLAASRDYTVTTRRFGDILLETYFFKRDAALAEDYLIRAEAYLERYQTLLGPYPYSRFAVVENRLPTGLAMPTMTLLGQQIIHLPFVLESSLGHEILHQWFGNYVYIDYASGNWAEGLVNYLADHASALERGEDVAYRKQILLNYRHYAANAGKTFPVTEFTARHDRAQSAVGYGKVAMIFHALHRRCGNEGFYAALVHLLKNRAFQAATWEDVKLALAAADCAPSADFWEQWLERADIPHIRLENATLKVAQGQLRLRLELRQNEPPYTLELPLAVYDSQGVEQRTLQFDQAGQVFDLALRETPNRVVLDEDYHLMRTLSPAEVPPSLAQILAEDKPLALIAEARREQYAPALTALGGEPRWLDPETTDLSELNANSLVLAGRDNPPARLLLGQTSLPAAGFGLKVFPHPLAPDKAILLLDAENAEEVAAAARKLPHYGKYSALGFNRGQNSYRHIAGAQRGLTLLRRAPTRALNPSRAPTLGEILPRLAESRVIFVGEHHDRHAHHLNQLAVIRYLHQQGHPLAIGMEMFQRPYQQALDDYLAGTIDEAEFLRESKYFEHWGYDYNLYKPLLDYARANQIPVLALNIDGELNRKIARQGLAALDRAERARLPEVLDLADPRYREDLYQVFRLHRQLRHHQEFEHFLQAQVVWDETMAQTAAEFLAGHPEHKLVILAGNGHLRYRYGIPQRLYRRTGVNYQVLAQDEELTAEVADYVLLSEPVQGQSSPMLGIGLDPEHEAIRVTSVSEDSAAERAGLQTGDILTHADGRELADVVALKVLLFYKHPGDSIRLEWRREGEVLSAETEL